MQNKAFTINRRGLLGGAAALGLTSAGLRAQPAPVRIAVINDQSGPLADLSGLGSVEAARLAIEDMGGQVMGRPIELLSADHQNKPDIGTTTIRKWFEAENVGAVFDLGNSSIALAAQDLGRQMNRVVVTTTAATTDLTGKACTKTGFHWVYDNYSNSAGLSKALVKQGLDTWFFITVDYAFGKSLESETTRSVVANGGKVIGSVAHPLNAPDFSSWLLQAQSSGAKAICFANNGRDLANSLKQAAEFGIGNASGGKQKLVAPVVLITDVHAMGLKVAQGLTFLTAFYWDMDDETRAWSQRFFARRKAMPTMAQAGTYSAVLHYLRSVGDVGSTDGMVVADAMRARPIKDAFARNASIRPDGRMVHDLYLAEVKKPAEQRYPWDYYTLFATVPGAEAFRPLKDGSCPGISG